MTLAPTVDEQLGQVLAVYELQAGGTLAADVAPGAATLTVVDPADFHELGGLLYLASGDEAAITSEVFRYTRADFATGVLTLEVAYPADWPAFLAGDYVWVSPLATERRVDVALDGEADQLVTARLPYGLSSQVAIGVRPPDAGEWLRVGLTPLGYQVVDVENEYPLTDPASVQILDPDTGEVIGELGSDAAFDTVTADAVYSDTVPYRNADDLTLYVDAVNGSDDNDGTAYPPLVDSFNRVIANSATGWGSADTGQLWTRDYNTGNLCDCDGTSGRIRTNGTGQQVFMRSAFGGLDLELAAVLNFSTVPAAGTENLDVLSRYVDDQNWYSFSLTLTTTALTLLIVKRSTGTYTTLATSAGLAGFVAGSVGSQDWQVRGQVQVNPDGGTDLRAKAWLDGTAEPEDWLLIANDTQSKLQAPSAVGIGLRSGASAATVLIGSTRSMTAAVIDSGGQAIDTAQGGVGPLQTIAEALERVGEWNDGVVRILLAGVIDEQVNVVGLAGGGRLIIDGANVATIYGTVNVLRCPAYVELRNFTLQDTGDIAAPNLNLGSVEVIGCQYVLIIGVQFQSNTSRPSNVYYGDGSRGRVDTCQMSGASTQCLNVVNACAVVAYSNTGSAPTNSYRCGQSILWSIGASQPTGGLLAASAGKIYTTTTVEAGAPTGGGGSAPPPSAKKTTTHTADKTKTWRPEWGWRTDNDEAYQGEYAGSGGLSRGCAFYGSKLVHAGKVGDSGKVYIQRLSQGGASQSQAVYLCSIAQGSQPAGKPDIVDGPTKVGELSWGQAKWFDIPNGWLNKLLNGTAKGLAVYHGSASPYIICAGRGNGTNRFQVKLTWH